MRDLCEMCKFCHRSNEVGENNYCTARWHYITKFHFECERFHQKSKLEMIADASAINAIRRNQNNLARIQRLEEENRKIKAQLEEISAIPLMIEGDPYVLRLNITKMRIGEFKDAKAIKVSKLDLGVDK